MPEAKRSKGSKKKGAAAAASSVEGPAAAAAVKEAFLCVHTCLLLLAEAARVQALTWAATPASVGAPLARAACGLGQQFLSVVGSMAAAAAASQAGGGTAPEADDVAAAVVANVARLARNVAAAARGAGGSTTRDLAPAMQQAQHAADSDQGSLTTGQGSGAAGGPQGDAAGGAGPAAEALVSDLLSLACQDSTSALVVAALKPGLAGLLAALCGSDPGPCGGQAPAGGSSCSSSWLRPVAELLGRGIDDLEEVPAVGRAEPGPGEAAEPQGEPRDENAAAAANPPEQAPDAGEPPAQAGKAGGAADLSRFASEHAQHALVKQLLASAKLAKVRVCVVWWGGMCTPGECKLATLVAVRRGVPTILYIEVGTHQARSVGQLGGVASKAAGSGLSVVNGTLREPSCTPHPWRRCSSHWPAALRKWRWCPLRRAPCAARWGRWSWPPCWASKVGS